MKRTIVKKAAKFSLSDSADMYVETNVGSSHEEDSPPKKKRRIFHLWRQDERDN